MKHLKTFASMLEVLTQHRAGLVSDSEALLALQCTPIQIECLIAHSRLPYKLAMKSSLVEWDEHVELLEQREDLDRLSCEGHDGFPSSDEDHLLHHMREQLSKQQQSLDARLDERRAQLRKQKQEMTHELNTRRS